jgi:DNA helicase-2/ATP-dependent DNA helicase PcrA
LSVHQAKGREYDRVGRKLKDPEVCRLAAGLDSDQHNDRVLYVAATRARRGTVLV